jgi:alpha-tubulin suppressor-like RCC1 family protein
MAFGCGRSGYEILDGSDGHDGGDIDGSTNIEDCIEYYVDSDGDGLGSPSQSITSCSPVAGYVTNADDCDDSSALCSDNCQDSDLDGAWDCKDVCLDADQDGYGVDGQGGSCLGIDCDESSALCNSLCQDDDLDLIWDCKDDCVDFDGDGFGVDGGGGSCTGPDCDETSTLCNSDCLDVDYDLVWDCKDDCIDADNDDYGIDGGGGTCLGNDCDDTSNLCDASCIDSDGDGLWDCRDNCMDYDGDEYGVDGNGGICLGTDCDDTSGLCNTVCEDLDFNLTWDCKQNCLDSDGDGYGSDIVGGGCLGTDCDETSTSCNTDCVDADLDLVWDCKDNCIDSDGDNYGTDGGGGICAGTDCDETSTFCNSICLDADLDLVFDCKDDCIDSDGDGYGTDGATGVCLGVDCDDSSEFARPGLTEGPNGDPTCSDSLDNDCSGDFDAADPACMVVESDPIFTQFSASQYGTMAITADGRLIGWGFFSDQSPTAFDAGSFAGTPFVQVSSGHDQDCALTDARQAVCWGNDNYGQLGNGPGVSSSSQPELVDVSTITGSKRFRQISCGRRHTCGVTGDGQIYCWGYNNHGQLGIGSIGGDSHVPVQVSTSQVSGEAYFIEVSAGEDYTCAITSEGALYCWGEDTNGRLGDGGTETDQSEPVAVNTATITGETYFRSISAGDKHACGITATGRVYCWGSDANGALGDGGGEVDALSPSEVNTAVIAGQKSFIKVQNGYNFSCGITADRVTYCWGQNDYGQLGNGTTTPAYSPTALDNSTLPTDAVLKDLVVGYRHACGLTDAGLAYCWGSDADGQLGDGGVSADKSSPSPVNTYNVSSPERFVDLAGGQAFFCGSTNWGKAYCWGSDNNYKLGNGTPEAGSSIPVLVDNTTIGNDKYYSKLQLECHQGFSPTGQNRLIDWGGGDTALSVNDLSAIVGDQGLFVLGGGCSHECLITAEGVAYSFGTDANGQLGDGGGMASSSTPVLVDTTQMTGSLLYRSLSKDGLRHQCGVAADGVGYCWGHDSEGQLGDGGAVGGDITYPVLIDTAAMTGSTKFIQVSAGYWHSCGIAADGKAYCWGNNFYGNLGDNNSPTDSASPVAVDTVDVTGDTSFLMISCGNYTTCAVTTDGKAYCWGGDEYGRLGNGDILNDDAHVPTPVNFTNMPADCQQFVWLAPDLDGSCGLCANGKAYCWGYDDNGQLGDGGVISTNESHWPVEVDRSALTP